MTNRQVEILAPAGSMESLRAAVSAALEQEPMPTTRAKNSFYRQSTMYICMEENYI